MHANSYKVSTYGRTGAVAHVQKHLDSPNLPVQKSVLIVWTGIILWVKSVMEEFLLTNTEGNFLMHMTETIYSEATLFCEYEKTLSEGSSADEGVPVKSGEGEGVCKLESDLPREKCVTVKGFVRLVVGRQLTGGIRQDRDGSQSQSCLWISQGAMEQQTSSHVWHWGKFLPLHLIRKNRRAKVEDYRLPLHARDSPPTSNRRQKRSSSGLSILTSTLDCFG